MSHDDVAVRPVDGGNIDKRRGRRYQRLSPAGPGYWTFVDSGQSRVARLPQPITEHQAQIIDNFSSAQELRSSLS